MTTDLELATIILQSKLFKRLCARVLLPSTTAAAAADAKLTAEERYVVKEWQNEFSVVMAQLALELDDEYNAFIPIGIIHVRKQMLENAKLGLKSITEMLSEFQSVKDQKKSLTEFVDCFFQMMTLDKLEERAWGGAHYDRS
jgi:hypothetical protein